MNKITRRKKRYNKSIKNNRISTKTPLHIRKISNKIFKKLATSSYSPTINRELVTIKSSTRKELMDCNIEKAFDLKEALQIKIPKNNKCYYYYTREAKTFLLKNLAANKHLNLKNVVPPIQSHSNCWFNTMFVTFFVSDKGRKFFHFLRQLMIEGRQQDGTAIPENLRDAFALLNFGVDSCLTGNDFAYKFDTNSIIQLLYKGIPDTYKQHFPYIVDIDQAGNPILYYTSIINYLNNNSIKMLFIRDAKKDWNNVMEKSVKTMGHLPHIIVLEIYDDTSNTFENRPDTFSLENGNVKYQLDSTVVRDVSQQHFCATLTCEGKEMGYDGMSFHRLVPLKWKKMLNSDTNWQFEGTNHYDGKPVEWNFRKSYQLLIYYRVK